MGLGPNGWGPYMWGAIHLTCLGAPETLDSSSRSAYVTFFSQLPFVLPCATCAQHLLENMHKEPVEASASGRDELFAWSVRLHNIVNKQLNKPVMTIEDARKHWLDVCTREKDKCNGGSSRFVSNQAIWMFFVGFAIGAVIMFAAPKLRKGLRRS